MKLPESQLAVLAASDPDKARPVAAVAASSGLPVETVTGSAFELQDDGLLELAETTETLLTLTDEGAAYADDGLPEVRLYEAAIGAGADDSPTPLGELLGQSALDGQAADVALSNFARKGYGVIDSGSVDAYSDCSPETDTEAAILQTLATRDDPVSSDAFEDTESLDALERRGLIERTESTTRTVTRTEAGTEALEAGIETTGGVGQLTPELLSSGEYQNTEFASYNVEAGAEQTSGGSVHVLRQLSQRVTDVLVGMGFEEMQGPHIDSDFWINDCLFMPQDHPARNHWDRFALSNPSHVENLPEELRERVESAHHNGVGSDGDGYHAPWDEAFARALALRGHTTNLSARYLSGMAEGDLEAPQRFFSVNKAYRNDTLDDTHLLEFFQIEGWVMADTLSVRDLMGTFEEFYRAFGITDIEFKPHYNPYTEPSFELFGRHPETEELIEIGNSGMFRPEMLEPLGVDCDVMAWGLALERLLMLVTGAEDIRDVHGTLCDLDYLRSAEVLY